MGIIVKKESESFDLHPIGTYNAKVAEVSAFTNNSDRFGERVKIVYKTKTGGRNLWDICQLKFSSKSKLGKRIQAILDRKWSDIPAEFDLSLLEGCLCKITIEHNVAGDKTYANVTSVAPAGGF